MNSNINTNNPSASSSNPSNFIIHQNIRSMRQNLDNFLCHLNNFSIVPKIIILSEIFIYDYELDNYKVNDYILYANCNSSNQNAGVAIYVHNSIDCEVFYLNLHSADGIQLNFSYFGVKLCVIGLYRHHSLSTDCFLSELSQFFNSLSARNVCLLGDININLLKNDKTCKDYLMLMAANGFKSLVNEPTRILSCIDHVFIRTTLECSFEFSSKVLALDITDHHSTVLCFESFSTSSSQLDSNDGVLKHPRIDFLKLKGLLAQESWLSLFNISEPNVAYQHIINILYTYIELSTKSQPLKANQSKYFKMQNWMSDKLARIIETKNEIGRIAKKHPLNHRLNARYKKLKKLIQSEIRIVKAKYYQDIINKFNNNPKRQWQTINELVGDSKKHSKKPIVLTDDRRDIVCDSNIVASMFNDYFSSIPKDLKNASIENVCYSVEEKNELYFSGHHEQATCFFTPITASEVYNLIHTLKNTLTSGHDQLSNMLVKEVSEFIAEPLAFIFNLCFVSGAFPDDMKKAIIIPLFKGNDAKVISNYRPISLLPVFSKILEKAIKNRMVQFLDKKKFFSKLQFGYIKGCSTEDALLAMLSNVYNGLNENKKVIGLFLDITKAFDTVDHSVLLSKLYRAGFRGIILNLLQSYLTNRYQCTKIDSFISDPILITDGVPQGSVLGPILFLIYINSLCKLNLNGKLVAFADDLSIIYSDVILSELEFKVSEDLRRLRRWFNLHSMVLSTKSKYLLFCMNSGNSLNLNLTTHFVCHSLACSIKCDLKCTLIQKTSSYKYLGVTLDNNLKFKEHADLKSTVLLSAIRKLYILRRVCPKHLLISLYYALVHSHIDYGIAAWGGSYMCNIRMLVKLQKFAVRIINFKHSTVHSLPLFRKVNILPLRYLFVYKVLKIFYKNCGYNKVKTIERYPLRNNNLCVVLFTKRVYCRRFYDFIAPTLYNHLPLTVKTSDSLKCFVKNVRNWLNNISNIEMYF